MLNFSQPGFQFQQKYAGARTEVARYKPALIMWESWVEWREYRMIADAAYGVSDYELRPDGFIGITGVPGWLNRLLFPHSRLYEYLALSYGERAHGGLAEREAMTAFANNRLIQVMQLAQSEGTKLVLYFAPPLDRTFEETVVRPSVKDSTWLEFAQAHGTPTYSLARELIDQDYLKLRLDPCCHFNAAGHRALAASMERIVLEQLDGMPPSSR